VTPRGEALDLTDRGAPARQPHRHDDPKLAQLPAQQVHASGAGAQQLLAHPMQLLQLLLLDRLQRHRAQLRAAGRFHQCGRIGRIGLVAPHVRSHVLRRQQPHLMALRTEPPPPVVRRPARLHHDQARWEVAEKAHKALSRKPLTAQPRALALADRQLEVVLCQVHTDGRSMHDGLLRLGGQLIEITVSLAHRCRIYPHWGSPSHHPWELCGAASMPHTLREISPDAETS
jgi:hypothetical protein